MTTPKIAKALSNLDDELIAAAAEEQAAPRLLTKKKVLALLAACLILVGTFAMMGMEKAPVGPTPEQMREAELMFFDDMIEMYQDDPEMVAYYTKWREIEIPSPWPEEWQNEDGSMKDFVTLDMLYEIFYDSVQYQYLMENPEMHRGIQTGSIELSLDENRFVGVATGVLMYRAEIDEEGNIIKEEGQKLDWDEQSAEYAD